MNEKQANSIKFINGLVYEQYDALWCKALCFSQDSFYGWEGGLFENVSGQNDSEIIKMFLEDNMTCLNPERYMLFYKDWHTITGITSVDIVDRLIEASYPGIEKQRKEAQRLVRVFFGQEVLQKLNELTEEEKKEMEWENFCEGWALESNGEPKLDFTDYPTLKRVFFEDLFDPDTVRFYTNVEEDKQKTVIDLKDSTPAVIGIDNNLIGIMWFVEL